MDIFTWKYTQRELILKQSFNLKPSSCLTFNSLCDRKGGWTEWFIDETLLSCRQRMSESLYNHIPSFGSLAWFSTEVHLNITTMSLSLFITLLHSQKLKSNWQVTRSVLLLYYVTQLKLVIGVPANSLHYTQLDDEPNVLKNQYFRPKLKF